jgi:hypothetical protein
VSYDRYVAWLRLTHGGRRGREQMPPRAQQEWDGLNFQEAPPPDPEEARRLYEGLTAF